MVSITLGLGSTINAIGYIIYSATNFCIICYFNNLSQKVSDQLMELREQLTYLSKLDANFEKSKTQAAIQLLNLFQVWQLPVRMMSRLEYNSSVILDIFLFWFWKLQKSPNKLGLNHHLSTYIHSKHCSKFWVELKSTHHSDR